MNKTSNNFQDFMKESGKAGQSFMSSIMEMSKSSALDDKTHELAYISVLSSIRLLGGLPFHVSRAKKLGASFEEVKSAVLVGMPVVGLQVTEAFEIAINSYND